MAERDVEPGAADSATRLRIRMLLVGVVLIAASFALGVWITVKGEPPFVIDAWWNETLAQATASPFLLIVSYTMNFLGGGWFGVFAVPILTAVVLIVLRRPWSALYFVSASLAGALVVQLMKHIFGRARPDEIIVLTDVGSYPSGHVANAATVAVAFAIIFPRLWVALVGAGWVLLMAFSRTYLHAHWLSDTFGGALVGSGVSLALGAGFAVLIAREHARHHRPDPALDASNPR
ncbi:phosphatase PAP2 family protein [Microbacterium sp. NPDC019599]|uniref:phosphatase PAP2 family protein n=1 Tax=Microbacterium sp. NPDC019599 TaxID=3154690 RepID=UPI0033EC1CED